KPKNIENTTSGSIALLAAAAIALLGMMPDSHAPGSVPCGSASGAWIAARNAATTASSRGRAESTAGAATAANAPDSASSTTNTNIAVRAVRPEAAASAAELIPTTTSAATSGTTVICSAFSHSLPTGYTISATRVACAGSMAASTRPAAAPSKRPIITRAGVDRRRAPFGAWVIGNLAGGHGPRTG